MSLMTSRMKSQPVHGAGLSLRMMNLRRSLHVANAALNLRTMRLTSPLRKAAVGRVSLRTRKVVAASVRN
jgi:hypothetical protein